MDGDCGTDLCWPGTPDPRVCGAIAGTPSEVRSEAARRCSAHPNCTTFAVLGRSDVKYFTVGVGGLVVARRDEWNAYVANAN